MTLEQWCESWLRGYERHRLSTVRQARVHVKVIVQDLGHRPIRAVRPSEVTSWVAGLGERILAFYRVRASSAPVADHDGRRARRTDRKVAMLEAHVTAGAEATPLRRDDGAGVGAARRAASALPAGRAARRVCRSAGRGDRRAPRGGRRLHARDHHSRDPVPGGAVEDRRVEEPDTDPSRARRDAQREPSHVGEPHDRRGSVRSTCRPVHDRGSVQRGACGRSTAWGSHPRPTPLLRIATHRRRPGHQDGPGSTAARLARRPRSTPTGTCGPIETNPLAPPCLKPCAFGCPLSTSRRRCHMPDLERVRALHRYWLNAEIARRAFHRYWDDHPGRDRRLGEDAEPEFFAHLSLWYGTLWVVVERVARTGAPRSEPGRAPHGGT